MAKRRGAHKRYIMKDFRIDEASFVDVPAQAGADVLFMKRDGATLPALLQPNADESEFEFGSRFVQSTDMTKAMPDLGSRLVAALHVFETAAADSFEKRHGAVPILVGVTDGHAHIVWLSGDRGGETSYGTAPDSEHSHDHPWAIDTEGNLSIAMNDGHDHIVDQVSVQAAMRELLIEAGDTPVVVADVVFARADTGEVVDVGEIESGYSIAKLLDELIHGEVIATHDDEPLGKAYMPDGSFPIRTTADADNAIAAAGSNPQADVARHIMKRARVLGLEVEDEVFDEIAKAAGPAGETSTEGLDMTVKKTTRKSAAADDKDTVSKADHDAVVAELALSKSMATLTDRQREHHGTLEGDAASTFLGLSVEKRDAELDNLAKGDPVVYTSDKGEEFRKSDDPRLVSMAKQGDADRKELIVEKAARSQATLEKRAADELGNLGGELSHRARLLKAVDGIEDEAVRKGVNEVLASANTAAKGIFTKQGARGVGEGDGAGAGAKLDELAKSLHQSDEFKGTYVDAYEKVSESHPELAEAAITGAAPTAS